MARRRRSTRKTRSRKATSSRCTCKIGRDGVRHCWTKLRGGGIKGCKKR